MRVQTIGRQRWNYDAVGAERVTSSLLSGCSDKEQMTVSRSTCTCSCRRCCGCCDDVQTATASRPEDSSSQKSWSSLLAAGDINAARSSSPTSAYIARNSFIKHIHFIFHNIAINLMCLCLWTPIWNSKSNRVSKQLVSPAKRTIE